MIQITKRKLMSSMVGVTASLMFTLSPAMAEKTMNLGFGAPLKSIYGLIAGQAKKHIEAETGGAIVVKLRHSSQIATETKGFKALQLGTADGFIIGLSNVSPHWDLAGIFDLPYAFQSPEHVVKVLKGSVGDKLRDNLYKRTKVHLPTFGPAVYRDFFNSVRPINSMADMKGIKIRVPSSKVMIKTYEAFGANPVSLPWSETPTALQTGTVQGGDNATAFIRSLKFYEHQKHLAVLDHFVAFAPIFVSDHFMKKLTPEQRKQVITGMKKAAEAVAVIIQNGTQTHRAWLGSEGGMKVTNPDKTEFIKAAIKMQDEYAKSQSAEFNTFLKMVRNAK